MNRALALFVIGLIFGGGIGFVVAAGNGVTFDGHDHANPAEHGGAATHAAMDHANMDHANMDHAQMHDTPIEVSATTAPSLAITVKPDPMAGHNLHVMVENFDFAPEQASLAAAEGQGHAHVYVNGVKLARLYGPWMHLDALPKGEVLVEVTLSANNHQPLTLNGAPIKASTTLEVE